MSDILTMVLSLRIPALLTRMSRRPQWDRAVSTWGEDAVLHCTALYCTTVLQCSTVLHCTTVNYSTVQHCGIYQFLPVLHGVIVGDGGATGRRDLRHHNVRSPGTSSVTWTELHRVHTAYTALHTAIHTGHCVTLDTGHCITLDTA